MADRPVRWDGQYEWKAVLVLSLGFGLVGLDRWIIAPLLPAIGADLHLSYQQMGDAVGVLALTWGVFSAIMGWLSDGLGRRAVLIPALVGFSVLSGLSGTATGIVSLLAIRGLMGATEGAYLATSVAATAEASHDRRRGMNLGLQLSGFTLFGLGLGPIIATQLLTLVPSWRWVFLLVGLPGLIVAAAMVRIIREPPHLGRGKPRPSVPWVQLFRSRNVVLAMGCLVCAMSCMFVLAAMIPSYLQGYLHLPVTQMGNVMSALGWGGFIGAILVTTVSDFLGRRVTMALAFVGALTSLYVFVNLGPDPIRLFWCLSVTAFFTSGLLALLTGPVSAESAGPALVSSAAGLISGTGEIFGGGIGPMIAGYVADHYGIQNVFAVSFTGLVLGIVLSLLLRETAPRRVTRAKSPGLSVY